MMHMVWRCCSRGSQRQIIELRPFKMRSQEPDCLNQRSIIADDFTMHTASRDSKKQTLPAHRGQD